MTDGIGIDHIGQISRTVSDIDQSVAWYRDVLGLQHLFTFDKLAFFDCGGTRLMLQQHDELQPAESLLYFFVPDIESAYESLKTKGIDFVQGPERVHRHGDGTEEFMAFFHDPEGHVLALMSVRKPSA
jgi:methylmalonyl-CoA/ethylmalonyl-CoA epimerase